MQQELLQYLRCPITHQKFDLQIISTKEKIYNGISINIINEGILLAGDFCYPIINGIPRLLVESIIDFEDFLKNHIEDFDNRKETILQQYKGLIDSAVKKNSYTKKSFKQEWNLFNYEKDTTWNANPTEMLNRFLREVDETKESIKSRFILDAGCGNGLLNKLIADAGATVLGFDFSTIIENAFEKNTNPNAWFIQADVQFPPVCFDAFDIVHCSGVLIHTNNTEVSFSCLVPCVKPLGKLSVWLYHPRKNVIHNSFNFIRKFTTKLPIKAQFYLLLVTLFPIAYLIKKIKGNKQNNREMMVDILDWMTPEFRWEHSHNEAFSWFSKRNFADIKVTTNEVFGFNIIGIKQ
jgi:SAM-dependent methyltransferase/uncharacterized protein YbaR (Trm112 family)